MNIENMSVESIEKHLEKRKMKGVYKYVQDNPIKEKRGKIIFEGECIKIPLPSSNRIWTFEVWTWIKNFVEEFPRSYPYHHVDYDNTNYQWVNISAYL